LTTLTTERQNAAIIRAVTTLGAAIGVPVTVEGIEDAATHAAVLALGARRGQGWYFGKAASTERTAELLSRLSASVPVPAAPPARLRAAS
jgi:EAL domain-containing protein (putative c-di-GMP-specific phosphodiesterase class I)